VKRVKQFWAVAVAIVSGGLAVYHFFHGRKAEACELWDKGADTLAESAMGEAADGGA
jgi:hypothetical protein